MAQVFRDRGVLAQDIAEGLGWSPPQISRLVRGRCRVTPTDVATILGMCGIVAGAERATLLELAEDPTSPTWLQEHGEPADPPALRELERGATHIACVDGAAVPPLLQSSAYAAAVLRLNPLIPDAEIDQRLAARARRQAVLDRAPLVDAFVGVGALSRNAFGDAVMSDQVHHLLRLSVRPNIRLRLVHDDAIRCPPFELVHLAEAAPVVYMEQVTVTLLTQRPSTVAGQRRIVARLEERALTTDESRAHLNDIASGFGSRLDEYV